MLRQILEFVPFLGVATESSFAQIPQPASQSFSDTAFCGAFQQLIQPLK